MISNINTNCLTYRLLLVHRQALSDLKSCKISLRTCFLLPRGKITTNYLAGNNARSWTHCSVGRGRPGRCQWLSSSLEAPEKHLFPGHPGCHRIQTQVVVGRRLLLPGWLLVGTHSQLQEPLSGGRRALSVFMPAMAHQILPCFPSLRLPLLRDEVEKTLLSKGPCDSVSPAQVLSLSLTRSKRIR